MTGNARLDWDRTVVRTPQPTPFEYSEIMAGGVGYVSGIDSASRTQASLSSDRRATRCPGRGRWCSCAS